MDRGGTERRCERARTVNELRAVIVGAGGMGKAWARAVADAGDAQLVGWVDIAVERVGAAIGELGYEHLKIAISSRLEMLLDELRPDFVIDVATPEVHHQITASCLERRIPVLGEKPMAATLAEAQDLIRRSEEASTLFVVSQNRRYCSGLIAFRRLVAEQVGELGQLNAEFYRAPRFGGFREEMDSPLLLDMAIHTFDAARYVIGADPVSVYCVEFNPPWSWYRGAASATAEFEFDNGVHFSYQGSWCAQGRETSWESSWRAVGGRGSAQWDGSSPPVADVLRKEDEGSLESGAARGEQVISMEPQRTAEGIAGSLADFVGALRGGSVPMNECHDNVKSFAMVMGALESSRCSARVPVCW